LKVVQSGQDVVDGVMSNEIQVKEGDGGINGQIVNVCVFLGVAALAFTVRFVLQTTR